VNTRTAESFLWGAVALGILYFVRKYQQALERGLDVAGQAYNAARFSTANLIETFFPLVDSNSMVTHAVTFPDGSRHAVPGESVDRNGFFTYQFARYRLMVNSQGNKIALAA
jgi:hypothetical protein